MRNSKAGIIKYLMKKKLFFSLPKTYVFPVDEWQKRKIGIIKEIKKNFKNTKLIFRSSAFDEDGKFKSSAGKYISIQNINSENTNQIIKSATKIIKSYKLKNRKIKKDEIIVQKQISNVSMSGVMFTYDLNTGAPYYVINYDDMTGKTDTVTAGSDNYSNKKIFIFRSGLNYLKSKRFRCLIDATIDLEKKLKNNFLDIEFAVDKKLRPYLFQARNITSNKKWNIVSNKLINRNLLKCRLNLLKELKPHKKIFGKSTVFGQMPDWNPAEMIGQNPENLSYSLYKKLITDDSWRIARKLMGYNFPQEKNLMKLFSGKPYINTRLSFNSFLPRGLNKQLGNKLVNFWLNKLIKNPELHDKIEFEIAITCFSFDIKEKIKRFLPKNISKKQIKLFVKKHKENTLKLINSDHIASIENSMKSINKLNDLQKEFKKIDKAKKKNFSEINKIIKDCIKYGVIPFAICARHGFIGQTLLNSLVNKKAISINEMQKFKSSFNTITTDFLYDMHQVAIKKERKKNFMIKYGHLRPGTYDIKSRRYDEYKSFLFLKQKMGKDRKYLLKKSTMNRIEKIIVLNKIKNFNSKDLMDYIQKSFVAREFSKFVFTKSVSEILLLISNYGKKNNIKKNDMSYLDLKDLNKSKKIQRKIISQNKQFYQVNKKIKLPQILHDYAGTFIVPFQVNSPNYVSNKKIRSSIVHIKNNINKINIQNKIVLIENADPGYDWIFSRKIKGLVTQYGGVNSHMAIRCAELNLPAAIGCGEKKFEELKKSKMIELDCLSHTINLVN